jgi:hypothetical protein
LSSLTSEFLLGRLVVKVMKLLLQGRMAFNPSAPNLQIFGSSTGGGRGTFEPRSSTGLWRDAMADREKEPPFELRVLEVALDVVSAHLEELYQSLELVAQKALEDLTKQVCCSQDYKIDLMIAAL